MSTRFVNALFLTTIMILMSLSGLVDNQENQNESPEALTLVEPQYATSPGHSVLLSTWVHIGVDPALLHHRTFTH